jgi:hypothetical protein
MESKWLLAKKKTFYQIIFQYNSILLKYIILKKKWNGKPH